MPLLVYIDFLETTAPLRMGPAILSPPLLPPPPLLSTFGSPSLLYSNPLPTLLLVTPVTTHWLIKKGFNPMVTWLCYGFPFLESGHMCLPRNGFPHNTHVQGDLHSWQEARQGLEVTCCSYSLSPEWTALLTSTRYRTWGNRETLRATGNMQQQALSPQKILFELAHSLEGLIHMGSLSIMEILKLN